MTISPLILAIDYFSVFQNFGAQVPNILRVTDFSKMINFQANIEVILKLITEKVIINNGFLRMAVEGRNR